MKILTIDPRPASKDAMISLLEQHHPVYGVEFTLSALLPYLSGNIDGQHNEEGGRAAIDIARYCELPPRDAAYAVVRPDVDALGAIAVLEMRCEHNFFPAEMGGGILDRIAFVAKFDSFAFGEWPGVRSVESLGSDESLLFGALNALCMNHKMPIDERVSLVSEWLITGSLPMLPDAIERVRVEKQKCVDDAKIIAQSGSIVAISAHFLGATEVGYCTAPVVVAMNDAFSFPGVEGTCLKYTICQFQAGKYVDLPAVAKSLNEIEKAGVWITNLAGYKEFVKGTWGGSPAIIGSPQGVSSSLSVEQVVAIVQRHML